MKYKDYHPPNLEKYPQVYLRIYENGDIYVKDYYSISPSPKGVHFVKGYKLTPQVNHNGYLCVCVKHSKWYKVHRLVALMFIPNPDNKPTVNHKDGNKQNNHVTNLEWATNTEQMQHANRLGIMKPVYEKLRQINSRPLIYEGVEYNSIKEAVELTGTNYRTIVDNCSFLEKGSV